MLREPGEDGERNSGEINQGMKTCKCDIFGNWVLWFSVNF